MNTRKNLLRAFLMSCLEAGWALVYVGHVKWVLRVAALLYVGVVLLGVSVVTTTPIGFYAFCIFIMLVKLGSATTAEMLTRKVEKELEKQKRRRIYLLRTGSTFSNYLCNFFNKSTFV